MGTAAFAVPSLAALIGAGHDLVGVFTPPDRPAGRGRKLNESPVKQAALEQGRRLLQPESLKSEEVIGILRELEPEVLVVVAYGKFIPRPLREIPVYGAVNVHGSLLPRYRGAAPVNWAIARGESETGVCVMAIDSGLDTGPVYGCDSVAIGCDETAPQLSERLAALGAELLVRTLDAIGQGVAEARGQDDRLATLAPRLRKEDGRIRWDEPAHRIHNEVRAFLPWPTVVVGFRGTPCRILETRRTGEVAEGVDPGAIRFRNQRLTVCCGDGGLLEVVRLQLENRRPVSGPDFAHGVRLDDHERFTALDGGGEP